MSSLYRALQSVRLLPDICRHASLDCRVRLHERIIGNSCAASDRGRRSSGSDIGLLLTVRRKLAAAPTRRRGAFFAGRRIQMNQIGSAGVVCLKRMSGNGSSGRSRILWLGDGWNARSPHARAFCM